MADECRVVEVAALKVCYGGISHISRILVGVAAAVVVTVVWPHTWDCRHCPSALHWETDGQRETRVTRQSTEINP